MMTSQNSDWTGKDGMNWRPFPHCGGYGNYMCRSIGSQYARDYLSCRYFNIDEYMYVNLYVCIL